MSSQVSRTSTGESFERKLRYRQILEYLTNLDNENGLPFITPLSPSQQESDKSGEKQFIVSIDMRRWQDLVSAFDIHEPLMVLKK
ncbi:hypothetical protein HF086_013727 [Spodoptera exigua]|uniref:Non-structural maintenance of chromosome element 4 C-terminal domain-containing protein n=1 Tax=Spodoptera exigua TaxID=7107 RepID=A0A922MC79_SPOEX|nr:hypothetical protein HF086_013727 [Spodoptera exigua]